MFQSKPASKKTEKPTSDSAGKTASKKTGGSRSLTPILAGSRAKRPGENVSAINAPPAMGKNIHEEEAQNAADRAVFGLSGPRISTPRYLHGALGEPVAPTIRKRVSDSIGASVEGLQVRQDPVAQEATKQAGAHAMAVHGQIWLGPRAQANNAPVIAHEAMHAIQQASGRLPAGVAQRITPKEYYDRYLDWGGLNLKEEELGQGLAWKIRAGEYAFVRNVFGQISWGDRDDVANAISGALTNSELSTHGPQAPELFDYLRRQASGGFATPSEIAAGRRFYNAAPILKNPTFVPLEPTAVYVQGMHRSMVLKADKTDPDAEIGDENGNITHNSDGAEFGAVHYKARNESSWNLEHTAQQLRDGSVRVDFDYHGTYDIRSSVFFDVGGSFSFAHTIEVEKFADVSHAAASNDLYYQQTADPEFVGPEQQSVIDQRKSDFQNVEKTANKVSLRRSQLLFYAQEKGLISAEIFNPARSLIVNMTGAGPAIENGTINVRMIQALADWATQLHQALHAATPLRHFSARNVDNWHNNYTGYNRTKGYHLVTGHVDAVLNAGHGPSMAAAIKERRFNAAITHYNDLRDGLDRWILSKMEREGLTDQPEYYQLKGVMALDRELAEIEGTNQTRIAAEFHPKSVALEDGQVQRVPLMMFYWKKDGEWHLKDLTAPNRPFEDTCPAEEGQEQPPQELFAKLDYREHFPEGVVHYQLPGERPMSVVTTGSLTFSDWLAIIALGLAVVGLVVVTAGTAAPAVAGAGAGAGATAGTVSAGTFGGNLLIASGIVGGIGAGAHMIERSQHGALDGTTAAIDILQIVGGFASAGAIVFGRTAQTTLRGVQSSVQAGWEVTGDAAQAASATGMRYIGLAGTAAGADVLTLLLISNRALEQYNEIKATGGDQAVQDRAMVMMFTQMLVLGGLTFLSVRGSIADIRAGNPIELEMIGGVYHARPRGYTAAGQRLNSTIPGAQAADGVTDGAADATASVAGGRKSNDLSDMTPEQYRQAGDTHVGQIRQELPADQVDSAVRVERAAQSGDWQVERTRRMLHPVVMGTRTGRKSNPMSAQDGESFRKLTNEFITTSADPRLSREAMRARLERITGQLESIKGRNPDALAALDISKLRRQIAALETGGPSTPILGSDGRLRSAAGEDLGTLDQFMREIHQANASNLARGVDRQYAVVLVDLPGGTTTVQIQSRPMSSMRAPTNLPNEPLTGAPNAEGTYIVDIGAGVGGYALDRTPVGERAGSIMSHTEYGTQFTLAPQSRRDMGIDNAGNNRLAPLARPEGGAVPIFGDALKHMRLIFGSPAQGGGVKRMFINNVSAHYGPQQYQDLAAQLEHSMGKGGRVEIRWDSSSEAAADLPHKGRGHIDGQELLNALNARGNRKVVPSGLDPTSYPFTINASGTSALNEAKANAVPNPSGNSPTSQTMTLTFQ